MSSFIYAFFGSYELPSTFRVALQASYNGTRGHITCQSILAMMGTEPSIGITLRPLPETFDPMQSMSGLSAAFAGATYRAADCDHKKVYMDHKPFKSHSVIKDKGVLCFGCAWCEQDKPRRGDMPYVANSLNPTCTEAGAEGLQKVILCVICTYVYVYI